MESTTNRTGKQKSTKPNGGWLRRALGGEFLLSKQMLPWYPYLLFVLILTCILIVSEQLIVEKKEKIVRLQNEYKAELSNLKANNQFIPYEENQMLIHKMEERGYHLNQEHTYTIYIKKPVEPKKGFLFFKMREKKKNADKDSLSSPATEKVINEKQTE